MLAFLMEKFNKNDGTPQNANEDGKLRRRYEMDSEIETVASTRLLHLASFRLPCIWALSFRFHSQSILCLHTPQ